MLHSICQQIWKTQQWPQDWFHSNPKERQCQKCSYYCTIALISHVWMGELDCEESWVLKNWCFWTVVLEKTLESPLDCKEIQPVSPKGDQPWIFIGRTDAEAGAPVFWQPDMKSQIIGKAPDPGKNWRQMKKREAEDEMVRCHHRLHVHKFVQTPGNSEGQGSLVCYSPWDHKQSDTTERLNNDTKVLFTIFFSII